MFRTQQLASVRSRVICLTLITPLFKYVVLVLSVHESRRLGDVQGWECTHEGFSNDGMNMPGWVDCIPENELVWVAAQWVVVASSQGSHK